MKLPLTTLYSVPYVNLITEGAIPIRTYSFITALFFKIIFNNVIEVIDRSGNLYHVDRESLLNWISSQGEISSQRAEELKRERDDIIIFRHLNQGLLKAFPHIRRLEEITTRVTEIKSLLKKHNLEKRGLEAALPYRIISHSGDDLYVTFRGQVIDVNHLLPEIAAPLHRIKDLQTAIVNLNLEKFVLESEEKELAL